MPNIWVWLAGYSQALVYAWMASSALQLYILMLKHASWWNLPCPQLTIACYKVEVYIFAIWQRKCAISLSPSVINGHCVIYIMLYNIRTIGVWCTFNIWPPSGYRCSILLMVVVSGGACGPIRLLGWPLPPIISKSYSFKLVVIHIAYPTNSFYLPNNWSLELRSPIKISRFLFL